MVGRLDDGHQRRRPVLLDGGAERGCRLDRHGGRLYEDIDGPVAAEPVTPDLLAIGGHVEGHQPRLAARHHLAACARHVVFQASAGQVADRFARRWHEIASAGPSIGRSPGRDNRGQRHRLVVLGHVGDCGQHLLDLAHGPDATSSIIGQWPPHSRSSPSD